MLVLLRRGGHRRRRPAPRPEAPRSGVTTESHTVTLVTGDVVRYVDGPGDRDTVTVDRPDGASGGVRISRRARDVYVLPDRGHHADRGGHPGPAAVQRLGPGPDGVRRRGHRRHTGHRHLPARPRQDPALPPRAARRRSAPSPPSTGPRSAPTRTGRAPSGTPSPVPPAPVRSKAASRSSGWTAAPRRCSPSPCPQVKAPEAWAAGFDGKGTKVAVLDTGIEADHPDVKDRLVGTRSFIPGEEVDDKNGHGTHVASTIAGSGAASEGANKGVAPGGRPARRQGPQRRGLRRGLRDHRGHGVGEGRRGRHRLHEPRFPWCPTTAPTRCPRR